MLPKKERFTKKDFIGARPHIFFRGTYFDVASVSNGMTKYACVISKKRIKRAVDRNSVKRKVYASIRSSRNVSANQSLIFYPKKTLLNASTPLVLTEIRKVFATLH
jgi:ribonuclease P protein component